MFVKFHFLPGKSKGQKVRRLHIFERFFAIKASSISISQPRASKLGYINFLLLLAVDLNLRS